MLTPKVSRSVGSSMAMMGRPRGHRGWPGGADADVREAGQGDDLPGAGRGDFDPLQPVEDGE